MGKKVLIVGGVAGGASTAARLRRVDETAEIIMFERGEYISFANCGLPYYIGEVIKERDKLLVQTPEAMKQRFNIDVRIKNEVLKIMPKEKQVEVKDYSMGKTYKESYDYLVLSPGADPIKPPIPGVDADNIFTLRNIPDTDAVKKYVDEIKPQRAVVVGGGFIGLEMAENLHERGVKVSLVEMAEQVMAPLDYEMAQVVHKELKSNNVDLYLKDGVASFEGGHKANKITLQSGRQIDTDMVILAIGVKAEVSLAKKAGLELGQRGIKVNEYLQTSDPNIYAAGDAIEVKDFVNGKQTWVPLAWPANRQGRIIANNMTGKKEKYKGTQGTSIAKVFDLNVASTGNSEKTLKRLGVDYLVSYNITGSHAGYYPGAFPVTIKLIFTPKEGKVLGAQVVGYDGVAKRIDVLATAIRGNMTVFDLQDLEIAYAPPFASAKDPVNIAGYVAENIILGKMVPIYWHEIEKLDENKTIFLDVRTKIENELGTLSGAINIPVDELRERLDEIPKDKEIITFCQVGLRGYIAARILTQHGFKNVRNLAGGYKVYKVAVDTHFDNSENKGEKVTSNDDVARMPSNATNINEGETIKIDCCGLQCPGPIMQVYQRIQTIEDGQVLEVSATDPGFVSDIKAWCQSTGNTMLKSGKGDHCFTAYVQKGTGNINGTDSIVSSDQNASSMVQARGGDNKTLVVFSGDLDKAIASFIIANGAAAMGKKVTMFFTFWGLNILRKPYHVSVQKGFMDKMFSGMMPRGSKALRLSKMNMLGMGPKMIRNVMKNKNVSPLEELIAQAKEQGVKMMACNMSMDLMGIKKEELIEGIDIGGVATYLTDAEQSNVNLFI